MNLLNVAEVIDLGIEKEKKRRDFYALAADNFSEKKLKDLFSRLKNWEETHIKKFSEIRNSIDEQETKESYPGELGAYMKAYIDDALYREITPEKFKQRIPSPFSAIEYAIGFEKDAILFFNELLPYVSSPNKEAIQQLIDEEKKHIVFLVEQRNKLEA